MNPRTARSTWWAPISRSPPRSGRAYLAGVALGLAGTLVLGMLIEVMALRALYERDHLDQVLATFG